jgi:hypothetical protein
MSITAASRIVLLVFVLGSGSCGMGATSCGAPAASALRDSFVAQLTANRFVSGLQRSGDEVTFSAPDVRGDRARWRVRIDAVGIQTNDDRAHPYKGIVRSSWFVNDQPVTPSPARSNLPLELTANGLAQECWALWDDAAGQWSWE